MEHFSRKRHASVDAFDQSKGVGAPPDVGKKFAQDAIDSIKKKANDYMKDKGVSDVERWTCTVFPCGGISFLFYLYN